MKTAVVCAAFDPAADAAIDALRSRVEAAGYRARRNHRPHVTLSAARVEDVESVIATASATAARNAPIALELTELGSFRGSILWVAPTPSDALRALHRDVYDTLIAAGWPAAFGARSAPDEWVAHCTIATQMPPGVLRQMRRAGITAFQATVDALAVILVGGRGDVAHLPLLG